MSSSLHFFHVPPRGDHLGLTRQDEGLHFVHFLPTLLNTGTRCSNSNLFPSICFHSKVFECGRSSTGAWQPGFQLHSHLRPGRSALRKRDSTLERLRCSTNSSCDRSGRGGRCLYYREILQPEQSSLPGHQSWPWQRQVAGNLQWRPNQHGPFQEYRYST